MPSAPARQRTACCDRCAALERDNAALRAENQQLRTLLESERRKGKRQAAPFSKGPPRSKPRRPGRRAGARYGKRGHRQPPKHVDKVCDAPLPRHCPDCHGTLEHTEVRHQYQTDIPPVRPQVTRFDVHVGHCTCCGKRVQGRHPLQTSDALGAAGSLIGPRAAALAVDLNKGIGLSYGKVQGVFADAFGLSITRGALCSMVARVGRAAEPTYQALSSWIRREPVVSPDETGWRVGALSAWLWAFVSPELTVYAIRPGRGFAEAAEILGDNFAGTLVRDGWRSYCCFCSASHQTCCCHILRRCNNLLQTAQRGAARVPHEVKRIIKSALALRDRRDAGEISTHGLRVATGKIAARTDRLLSWNPTDPENAKLLDHLDRERQHGALFTFLRDPNVPATNFWAEQAIRPAVVNRKVWGGNRTWSGAHTQEILTSVLRTCRQQGHHPSAILIDLLRSPDSTVATLLRPSGLDAQPP